jgi:hypothetical protein
MPNGHDKNWIRLLAAIDGFRVRHGHWPSRVRAFPGLLEDLRGLFAPDDFAQITSKIKFVADDAPVIAEDESGATYSYGQDGFPDERPSPTAAEWFGVEPQPDDDSFI